jgi:hypothetical protein
MAIPRWLRFSCAVLIFCALSAVWTQNARAQSKMPPFGKDTVLVWSINNQEFTAEFVARIAEFLPDRFLEWEDSNGQGTVFMPSRDVAEAKGFVNTNLFGSGMDTRGKNVTTLWLSQRIYRELKQKKKAKCNLDGVPGSMAYEGEGQLNVEVNKSSIALPIIKVSDDRGGERWFLDQEENPLMLKHTVRHFTQVLTSITTDRKNTLRWIKGKKLSNLPQ